MVSVTWILLSHGTKISICLFSVFMGSLPAIADNLVGKRHANYVVTQMLGVKGPSV